ncbi:hypothetical protein ACFB49_22180 [Sphingomonas sp. DBB INV C78]|uniref:DUF5818 domain-containing protein n=1 Tax=Sphingomonas sp. DBB INV C78 TaxID=3349434 RepID=UPI0036D3C412
MPRGKRVADTGLLIRDRGLILQRDAGGTWRLDVNRIPVELIGCRVRITGTRSEFDLVDVDRIEPC